MNYYYIIWYAPFFSYSCWWTASISCWLQLHGSSLAFAGFRPEPSGTGRDESIWRIIPQVGRSFQVGGFSDFFQVGTTKCIITGPSFLVGSKIFLFRFCSEWWMMMNFYLTLTCWRRQPELPFVESHRIPRHLGLNIFMLLVVGIRLERYHGHWRTLASWKSNIPQISEMWSIRIHQGSILKQHISTLLASIG